MFRHSLSGSSRLLLRTHGLRQFSATAAGIDGVVVGFKNGTFTQEGARINAESGGQLERLWKLSGKKKAGEAALLFGVGPHDRVVVVSMEGKGSSPSPSASSSLSSSSSPAAPVSVYKTNEAVRLAIANGVKILKAHNAKNVAVESLGSAQAAAEGAHLALYKFNDPIKVTDEKEQKKINKEKVNVKILDEAGMNVEAWKIGTTLAEAQIWARTLAETPANLLTPTMFAESVKRKFTEDPDVSSRVSVTIHDQAWAESKKMGLFLSVAKGSVEPLRFLELRYNGGKENEAPLALVGKGVTFDSGGISIKPSSNMHLMKGDMGGAAAVLSALYGIAKLQLPLNVVVLTPLTENMPSGHATRPGDVVRASNGKTVEILDTDAEGRLILADALHYAQSLKPHTIIDVATLTGAIGVALGTVASGVFSPSLQLLKEISTASKKTGELVWPMPLLPAYKKQLLSNVADLKNIGGRAGGACTAAMFLKQFVTQQRWMHWDIAGIDHSDEGGGYTPKGMTGAPTRTLIEFARYLALEGGLTNIKKQTVAAQVLGVQPGATNNMWHVEEEAAEEQEDTEEEGSEDADGKK